ncbi:MAG: hypothetical protein IJX90_11755 [Blautia sp.]|nr:hypothetical protein [Blautia sp.]
MARRFRYAFVKRKEAAKGKLSVGCAIASFVLFAAAVLLSLFLNKKLGFLVGGVSIFAALLAAYGFLMGLASFSEQDRKHGTSMVGSILCGLFLVGWVGLFLLGV